MIRQAEKYCTRFGIGQSLQIDPIISIIRGASAYILQIDILCHAILPAWAHVPCRLLQSTRGAPEHSYWLSIVEGSTYSILFICLLMHSHSIDTQSRKSVLCGLIVIATALIVLFAIFQEEGSEWIIVYIVVEVYVLIGRLVRTFWVAEV